MTVENTALSVSGPYNTDGSTTNFAITFQYIADNQLIATLLNTVSGASLIGVLNSDFSVTDNVPPTIGGNITILAHAFGSIADGTGQIPAGYTLTISQDIPLTQLQDYPEGSTFPSEDITQALDKLTLIDQEQAQQIQYSLQAPVTDSAPDMILPPAQIRANKYLTFDGLGNPAASGSVGTQRGVWTTATQYNFGDFVIDGVNGNNTGNYYFCTISNISGVWATDLAAGKWTQAVDFSVVMANFNATSTTSNTIPSGTGNMTFATQANKNYFPGQFIIIASRANLANYVHGQVFSYSGTTLVIDVIDWNGSGTHTDWNISLSGSNGTSTSGITQLTGAVTAVGPGSAVASISNNAITSAKIASSVALAGSPTTTTQSGADNSTKIATTAMVQAAITAAIPSGSIKTVSKQIFTSSGTYTPSTGMAYCLVRIVGGGGGGGVGGGASAGGAGGGAEVLLTAAQIGASKMVTIGAGGAITFAGGSSSLGTLAVATGGQPGPSPGSGNSGSGTTGDLLYNTGVSINSFLPGYGSGGLAISAGSDGICHIYEYCTV